MEGRNLKAFFLLAGLLAHGHPVFAQGADAFPAKPVTIIVAAAAGGPIDIETRLHARKMSEFLGQSVLIDYRAGALGAVGASYVAKSRPDGYTLLVVTVAFTITPAFMQQSFDVIKDFSPIALMSQGTTLLVASPAFAPKNMREYIAFARANPNRINFGSTGPSVVIGAWLHSATKTTFTLVPYKGISAMMTDLMAGRLDVSAANLGVAIPLLKTGKLRALGVLNNRRSPALPDLPTLQEQGVEDFNYQNWLGYLAPARTSPDIINKLNTGFLRSLKFPDVIASLEAEGKLPWGTTPLQFQQHIATELARWRQLARETGYKLGE